jgi:hypothetical protein
VSVGVWIETQAPFAQGMAWMSAMHGHADMVHCLRLWIWCGKPSMKKEVQGAMWAGASPSGGNCIADASVMESIRGPLQTLLATGIMKTSLFNRVYAWEPPRRRV